MILLFGKITGIHGIKGEIEVSFNDNVYFSSLPSLKPDISLYVSEAKNKYKIIDIKKKKLTLVFKLANIDTIESATLLMGNNVYIETSELEELDNNTFYTAELLDYSILFKGNVIGIVEDCYITKANTVLDIKLEHDNLVSIPFVSAYFGDVSKENKTIELINIDILKSI